MAKKKPTTAKANLRPKVLHTWEVTLPDGTVETVTAHDSSAYDDVLTFTDRSGDSEKDAEYVLTRGFAGGQWRSVKLVVPEP